MLDVRRSRELQAAVLALKGASTAVRRATLKSARETANPEWRSALSARSTRPLDGRIIEKGARVALAADRVTLMAATSTRPLSGGLVPSLEWQGEEFGMRTRRETIATTSRKGRPYRVTKMIGRQFPNRQKQGRVAFDAASEVGTKIVAGWVRSIVDTFRKAPFEIEP